MRIVQANAVYDPAVRTPAALLDLYRTLSEWSVAVAAAGLATVDAPDTTLGGTQDGVLTVIDPENGGIPFRTYIGGTGGSDVATSVALTADRRPKVDPAVIRRIIDALPWSMPR